MGKVTYLKKGERAPKAPGTLVLKFKSRGGEILQTSATGQITLTLIRKDADRAIKEWSEKCSEIFVIGYAD